MSQSPEQIEQRALQDRLIDEHRKANAEALKELKVEAPKVANRYIDAMDNAMSIMRGG